MKKAETSLAVQWLKLRASTAGGTVQFLFGDPYAAWCGQKEKGKQERIPGMVASGLGKGKKIEDDCSGFMCRYTKNSVRSKSLQSFPTLRDPVDCSLTGSSVHGVLQARIVEWTAMPSSKGIFPIEGLNLRLYVSCIDRWVTDKNWDTVGKAALLLGDNE